MSAITIASSAAARIGQFVRLLGSDRSGEVVAAATAIKRTLTSVGLDLHHLADIAEIGLTTTSAETDFDIPLAIRFCARRADALGEREREFVRSLDHLARRIGTGLELSPKQESWLLAIFERLRGHP
jgi:hypothetical protein